MDYTPWPEGGASEMEELFGQYAQVIGSPEQLAIGVSCMGPADSGNFTPLTDVEAVTKWEPSKDSKAGVMLYTFSYDVPKRPVPNGWSGTGSPAGTWTETIHQNLP